MVQRAETQAGSEERHVLLKGSFAVGSAKSRTTGLRLP